MKEQKERLFSDKIKHVFFFIFGFVLIFSLTDLASATSYYISPTGNTGNNGLTADTPKADFSFFSVSLPAAGDIVYLRGGTYSNKAMTILSSGTAGNPITITNYNGEVPIIDGVDNTQNRDWVGIRISNRNYINISNITITNFNLGVLLFNSSYIKLSNLTTYNNTGNLANAYPGSVFFKDSNNIILENSDLHDDGGWDLGTGFYQNSVGIQSGSLSSSHNITIKNNKIHDNPGMSKTVNGLSSHNLIDINNANSVLSDTRDIIIKGNRIYNITSGYKTASGIYAHKGDPSYRNPRKLTIINNIISGTRGIQFDQGQDSIIENNTMYNNYMGFSAQFSKSGGNNTLINNTMTNTDYYFYVVTDNSFAPNTYRNNTIPLYQHDSSYGNIVDPKGSTYEVLHRKAGEYFTISYTNGTIFSGGSNTTKYYPTKSEYITNQQTQFTIITYPMTARPASGSVTVAVNKFDTSLSKGNILVDFTASTTNSNNVAFTVSTLKPNTYYIIKNGGIQLIQTLADPTGKITFSNSVWPAGSLTIEESNSPTPTPTATPTPAPTITPTPTPSIIPLASVNNLKNISYKSNYINWTWTEPITPDLARVMVYINGNFKTNVTKGIRYYQANSLIPNTEYTISTHTVNTAGKINMTWVNHSARTAKDNVPPASITNLASIDHASTYIKYTWTDPKDADFAQVMVYINGIFKTNVAKGVQNYNATGLIRKTSYKMSTHTVDTSGNINQTWINRTEKTSGSYSHEQKRIGKTCLKGLIFITPATGYIMPTISSGDN